MPTPFALHVERWKDCTACHLAPHRDKIVISRGRVPCDILFIGEAPGASEDSIGAPFKGPAGHLLDEIIADGLAAKPHLTYALTNLVCCIPRIEDGVTKAGEPDAASILACAPRLDEFIAACHPRLIVTVGKLPAKWFKPENKHSKNYPEASGCELVEIHHPAGILRANVSQQGLMKQKCILALEAAVEDWA